MDIPTLQSFFMWCCIINGSLLAFWIIMLSAVPDLVYQTQRKWFPLEKEQFTVVMYGFLGLFKIFFMIFNFTPLIALLIIG